MYLVKQMCWQYSISFVIMQLNEFIELNVYWLSKEHIKYHSFANFRFSCQNHRTYFEQICTKKILGANIYMIENDFISNHINVRVF